VESLKERLITIDSVQSKRPCRVREIKETLDEETSQILEDLLTKSKTSLRAIHAELRVSDIRVAREALGVHRNNWCGCKETETV
jgi:predicted Zn-ribbon and HTH transcriptional regulator